MSGAFDPLYIAARRSLLDCLDALSDHRRALVLVGAQAIYVRLGEADIAVAPFTKDADVMLEPALLATEPTIKEAMESAKFTAADQPGTWISPAGIPVDLLVAAAVAGGGASHRGARLPEPHGRQVARRVKGLEGALIDSDTISIGALEPADARAHDIRVAGPAALLVSKLHKIGERAATPSRLNDKDAYDVFRILRGTETADLAMRFKALENDDTCSSIANEALEYARQNFGAVNGTGIEMLQRAVRGLGEDETQIAQACTILLDDLFESLTSTSG